MDYPIEIPWTAWGFQTRMMLSTLPRYNWTIRVHGTRIVLQIKGDVPDHYKIRVLDFNPYNRSVPEEMLSAQSLTTSRYVSPRQDDVINNSFIFKDTIYTTLPYLEVTTKKFFMADSVMIDHDHIYLVQVSLNYSQGNSNHIHSKHEKGKKSKCWPFKETGHNMISQIRTEGFVGYFHTCRPSGTNALFTFDHQNVTGVMRIFALQIWF